MNDRETSTEFSNTGSRQEFKGKKNNSYNNKKGKKGSGFSKEDKYNPKANRGRNDASWYAQSPQLLNDAASISFSVPVGGKFSLGKHYPDDDRVDSVKAMPGIMAFNTIFTPGISKDATSPVNIASRNLYSFVRHANAGHSNYEAADLMLYVLAMDNLYAMHAWMVRLYGTVSFYLATNRYLARYLVEAQGFNFDNITANLADLRYFINQFGNKLSAFSVPNTFNLFKRHAWMYSNVYMDAASVKSQMYIFKPEGFLKYKEMTEGVAKGRLEYKPIVGTNLTLSQLQAYVNDIFNAMISSEDLNIMSGDVLKAYGSAKMYSIAPMAETYTVVPVYNLEVLTQIHNIAPAGEFDPPEGAYFVDQNPNNGDILCDPRFTSDFGGRKYDRLFDLPFDAPTPADVMVASRLMNIARSEFTVVDGNLFTLLDSCGSEIITRVEVMHLGMTPIGQWGASLSPMHTTVDYADETISWIGPSTAYAAQFNLSPLIYSIDNSKYQYDSLVPACNFDCVIGGVTNFTVLNASDLRKMHECALLSLFDVPAMGNYSR